MFTTRKRNRRRLPADFGARIPEGGVSRLAHGVRSYREKAMSEVFKAKTWTIQSLADGFLFVRGEKELVALDPRR